MTNKKRAPKQSAPKQSINGRPMECNEAIAIIADVLNQFPPGQQNKIIGQVISEKTVERVVVAENAEQEAKQSQSELYEIQELSCNAASNAIKRYQALKTK